MLEPISTIGPEFDSWPGQMIVLFGSEYIYALTMYAITCSVVETGEILVAVAVKISLIEKLLTRLFQDICSFDVFECLVKSDNGLWFSKMCL